MKLFSIERNHWSLFRNMYTYILEKIQQEIISKVCNVFIFYHIVSIDTFCMLDFKTSIWQLFHTRTLSMSIVDLTVNISQWKNALYNNCIQTSLTPRQTLD